MARTEDSQPSTAGNRSRRTRALVIGVLVGALTRPATLLFHLLTVPIFLNYLGRTRYGVYESVTAMALWLGLVNAGLTLSMVNGLIEANARQDRDMARKHVAATLVPVSIAVLVLGVIGWLLVPFLPYGRMFRNLDPTVVGELPSVLRLALLGILAVGVAALPACIYNAHQKSARAYVWEAVARLISVAVCYWVATKTRTGLLGAVFAVMIVPVAVRIASGYFLFRHEMPWLTPRVSDISVAMMVRALRSSILFMALQLSIVALYHSDTIIVGALIGVPEAAEYSVVAKVFVLGYGAFSMVYNPLWAGHGEAVVHGDWAWVRRTIRWTILIALLACAVGTGAMLLFGDRLLRLWLHASVPHSPWLIIAFAATFALRAWNESRAVVLNARGIMAPQLAFWLAHGSIAILLSILGARWGATGIAWAMPIAGLLTTFWGYPWMLERYVFAARTASNPAQ